MFYLCIRSLVVSGSQEERPGIQGMLFAMERVFIDAESCLKDTDFMEVVADKVLMYLKDSKVWFATCFNFVVICCRSGNQSIRAII